VHADVPAESGGGFTPDSFADMRHREVAVPGLDPAWHHTLVGVTVAQDRNSAELVIHCAPRAPKSLDRGIRLVTWLPAAHVKAHDADGNELAVTKLDAPLQLGQHVEVAGVRYRVTGPHTHGEMWPHRDPDSGTCHQGIDYQHVTLNEDPEPPHLPTDVGE
jgi:hypothetical protein